MNFTTRKISSDIFGFRRQKYIFEYKFYEREVLVQHFANNCQIISVSGLEDLKNMCDFTPLNLDETLLELYNSALKLFGVPRILIDVNEPKAFIPNGFKIVGKLDYVSSYDKSNRQMILIEKK